MSFPFVSDLPKYHNTGGKRWQQGRGKYACRMKYNGRGWKAVITGRPRFHVFAAPFFVDGGSKLALLKQLIRRPHYARKFHEAPATACDVPLFHPCGLYIMYADSRKLPHRNSDAAVVVYALLFVSIVISIAVCFSSCLFRLLSVPIGSVLHY